LRLRQINIFVCGIIGLFLGEGQHGLVQVDVTVDEQTGPLNLVEVGLDVLALDHELVEVVQAHVPVFLRQVLLLQGAARLLGQAGPCFLVYFNY